MADRGDVFQLKRRIGFGADDDGERVVVVQADALNSVLPTVLVVPLEPQVSTFAGMPLGVRVSAKEAGATHDHVAIASWIHVARTDRLAPGRVGRLNGSTMVALTDRLRMVLDL
jgi:mRNA-degrading endonuclease toxin of MazEF toxin-antitoxin module